MSPQTAFRRHEWWSGRWGPVKSLLALAPILVGAPLLAVWHHNALPAPLTELTDPHTHLPQISETRILDMARYLSEDIGYRTVGTYEHALGDKWFYDQVLTFQKECERVVSAVSGAGMGPGGRKLECEVWRQQGSGSHRFDMMGKRLYKTYVNLTNMVVRISNGSPKGKEHAILVNAHLDSTLPSPGAADDAMCVGVMMDVMRVLVGMPAWSPEHAIIFLFNNAEESLQDGSHLFSTQHPIAPTVRAVINLEAAGTTGRELLFQASSEQMIQAYAHVPRPFGTILANEIFSSGVILSDTDFRQFEQYLNVTGLDMAVVGNSYLYHMRKDLVENIQPGVAQHMAENVLALVKYLSSDRSPLPTLTEGYAPPSTVFFSHIGVFVIYSFTTARIMYASLCLASILWIRFTDAQSGLGLWVAQARGVAAVLTGFVGGVVVANVVAVVMAKVLGRGMSWFTNEYSALVLYGVPMLLGILLSQYLFGPVPERTIFTALLLVQSAAAFIMQACDIGSAVLFFISALPLFVALVLNPLLARGKGEISLATYAIGGALPILTGWMLILAVVRFFVPLTGRIGADAPADNVIASVISALGFKTVSFALPFAHRFGRRSLRQAIILLSILTVLLIAVFAAREPFDAMHQKRLFVIHSENITSNERHLHISDADGAPGFEKLVNDIALEFVKTQEKPVPIVVNEENPDWDTLYPFSKFLAPYKFSLPVQPGYVSPWANKVSVVAENDVRDVEAGTRSMTLKVYHPGLIWTVIVFNAHVLKWTLDDHPPDEYVRHHIKEASFYNTDVWSVDLVIKLNSTSSPSPLDEKLRIDFIGLDEKGIWPAKEARVPVEERGEALRLFERFDSWLDGKTGGAVDALLMGTVAGVISV
ncbi:hypothetical protein AX15_005531 [Amanita polypyramis BW_CC]|nr:hypothetical protein AX15_005531 [Amanita polypyramis BW_CC]